MERLKVISTIRYKITHEEGSLDIRLNTFSNGTHSLKAVIFDLEGNREGILDMCDEKFIFKDFCAGDRTEEKLSHSFNEALAYILTCPQDFQISNL